MKKLFLILLFLSPLLRRGAGGEVHAQTAPGIEWQNTIGGGDEDVLWSIKQTFDGGYILGGSSKSGISGDKTEANLDTLTSFPHPSRDYWIIKLDATGSIVWQNTIGGNEDDLLNSIEQTSDGGYILGGVSGSNISGDKTEDVIGYGDYWIVKTDSLGNILWQNTIGGTIREFSCSVKQTSDGGYFVYGISDSDSSGDKTENNIGPIALPDFWIVKTDSIGNVLWQNTIGGNASEEYISAQETTDGGYILGGISYSNSNGFSDYCVIKVNSLGIIQWQNNIGGTAHDELYYIQQTSDGGYMVGGYSDSPNFWG